MKLNQKKKTTSTLLNHLFFNLTRNKTNFSQILQAAQISNNQSLTIICSDSLLSCGSWVRIPTESQNHLSEKVQKKYLLFLYG